MFKAHGRLYHSTLGLRVIKKKKDLVNEVVEVGAIEVRERRLQPCLRPCAERVLYCQPTGPSPLFHRDDWRAVCSPAFKPAHSTALLVL